MAAAHGEDIKGDTDGVTTKTTRKKPCRVCSDFKSWMKTRHSNKKVNTSGNQWF